MADYVATIDISETTYLLWSDQYKQDYTVNPDGSITYSGLTVWEYVINGYLALGSEAATTARARQLAEFYTNQERVWHDEPVGKLWKATFCQTDDYGNFYAWIQRPYITNRVGLNRSDIYMPLILIGTNVGFQSCYIVDDLDTLTSDWGI